jgi:tRNA threonylcarbamoyladenosine biosynthesis protein TsaE
MTPKRSIIMSDSKLPSHITTASPEETQALGRRLSAFLAPGDVVCFRGNLGAGKTCLIQGICKALGVNEPVVSPSFTLVNEYSGRVNVAHLDFYRLHGGSEVEQLGFDDLLDGSRIVLIEWPERAESFLPGDRLDITMVWKDEFQRDIELKSNMMKWRQLIEKCRS